MYKSSVGPAVVYYSMCVCVCVYFDDDPSQARRHRILPLPHLHLASAFQPPNPAHRLQIVTMAPARISPRRRRTELGPTGHLSSPLPAYGNKAQDGPRKCFPPCHSSITSFQKRQIWCFDWGRKGRGACAPPSPSGDSHSHPAEPMSLWPRKGLVRAECGVDAH